MNIFQVTGKRIIAIADMGYKKLLESMESAGYTVMLLLEVLAWLRAYITRFRESINQMFLAGVQSLAVVILVGAFSGMVLALQSGLTLRRIGAEELLATIVPLAMIRQMAPIMTALILAGRVGSSMAAEIGTMAVSEELDALEVMSIDPVRYLVMPRFVAFALVAPVLTFIAAVIGTAAAGVVAELQVGLSFNTYWQGVLENVDIKDVNTGLFKAFIFGVAVSVICCSAGLRTRGGAAGVGESTRKAVVDSFLCIIVFNYFLTSIIQRWFYN